jgi:hypothetical protein
MNLKGMSGSEIVRTVLATPDTSVNGVVYPTDAGLRVRADEAEQGEPFPFVIFRRVAIERDFGLDNTLLSTMETFAIECWGDTAARAQALEAQVVDALLAQGIPPSHNEPDGKDPYIGVNCVVIRADIWT